MKKIALITLVSLPILMTNCQVKETASDNQEVSVKVKTMRVDSSEDQRVNKYSGTVEEASETALSFPVAGTIQEMRVRLGDRVTKGQLIATIDPSTMRNSHAVAKAALEQAEDAFRRMKELHDKGSLSEIKWVEIQSKLEQARSLEEIARKNLEDCRLYAPYDGVISEKMGESGLNVMPGVPVARLVSVNQLKVKVSVPETEISNIALSWEATIQVPALNDQCFKGTVIEKGIVANPLSRSYDVKIRIDNPDKSLMPGMVVKVGLRSPEEKRSFVLPAYIVQLDENNRTFVWVNNGGKAQRRFVTCGDYTAHGVTVVSGLDAGDEVIVEGQQKVCENVMLSL